MDHAKLFPISSYVSRRRILHRSVAEIRCRFDSFRGAIGEWCRRKSPRDPGAKEALRPATGSGTTTTASNPRASHRETDGSCDGQQTRDVTNRMPRRRNPRPADFQVIPSCPKPRPSAVWRNSPPVSLSMIECPRHVEGRCQRRDRSCGVDYPRPQQPKAGSSIHLPLDRLQSDHRAVAPLLGHCRELGCLTSHSQLQAARRISANFTPFRENQNSEPVLIGKAEPLEVGEWSALEPRRTCTLLGTQ
jgi:hypothetical protein